MKSTHQFLAANSFEQFPMEDTGIDLIVTSPPYPMIQMWDQTFVNQLHTIRRNLKGNGGPKAFEKMHRILDQSWAECYRVLRPGGFLVINIGDATRNIDGRFRMYSNHSRIINACHKIGFDVLPHIIWRKPTNSPTKFMGSGMLPAGAYVTLEHEYILVFRKEGKREFTEDEKQRRRESAIFWEERNQWYADQWEHILGTRQQLHDIADRDRSAAYPLEIAMRPILMYSMYGDTVLDPFGGTGTTTLAAMMSGRHSVYLDHTTDLMHQAKDALSDPSLVQKTNEWIDYRLQKHQQYCHSKEALFFKYRNEHHHVPVKTTQEKDLRLYRMDSIKNTKKALHVKYV